MFLKSLEIRGFKSFADKTELKFNGGITAVVGPNGSGKSNVSDAVRWVLGEQSAKTLRGSKMEDIIFTGTEYRKPIGFAQVSLTLDNSDGELPIEFNDVKITRRIFRSGESEYLINNSSCRLKDITTLFMDTGIGKEGYSLIGQGKIDAILSGKPEERRALLEEAAGIVKFKSRKNEAERKLENTRENLIRINDIIYTYEERLGPLEEEKNKAIEYMEYASELQKKEIALIVNNLLKLENEIETQKNKINGLIEVNNKAKDSYKNKREELLKLKVSLEQLEESYSKDQNNYFNKKDSISKAMGEIELLNERVRNTEETLKKSTVEIQENNIKLEKLKDEKSNLELEYDKSRKIYESFDKEIDNIDQKVKELYKELTIKEKEELKLKDHQLVLLRDISTFKNKNEILNNQKELFKTEINSLEINKVNFDKNLKINLATKVNLEKELSEVEIKREDIVSYINNNDLEKQNINNEIVVVEKQLHKSTGELHRVEANKDMLEKLENQYEGYNVPVKKIMESINNGELSVDKSKCIVLGEAIKTSSGYETAIEISLGGAISNIITEDEETAKYLINYLKFNKIGRATFLPLSTVKSSKITLDKNITEVKGYLGIASDLVKFDEKYANAVNYILGKTIICDNIDNALNIARRINYRNRIVTIAGEVVNAGGALTGGSIYQKNMGIMSRKNEVEELKTKIASITKDKTNISLKHRELLDKRERLQKEREDLTQQVYQVNLESADIKNKIRNLDDEILKLKNSFKISELEINRLNEKFKNSEVEIIKLKEKIKNLEVEEVNNKESIKKIEVKIKDINNNISNIKDNLTDIKIKKAQIEEVIDNRIKELKRNNSEIEVLKEKFLSLNNYISHSTSIIEESLSKIQQNEVFVKEESEGILLLEEKSKIYELDRSKQKNKLQLMEGELESLTIELAKKDDEIHRNEIIYTKQENEMNIYHDRLQEEFNTSFEKEKEEHSPIGNLEDHKEKVSILKNKISALGSVNVNAIEEFKDVFEKHRFIITEKEDLEKAQEELINVIDEMTSKMRVVFRQNFQVLNRYFDETFKELFKGGAAKLKIDEGDELTGNIEINVQPPGKKVQNINLMSGGEKVLSAIAILFAILKMKPTPFCILDEIEAALDDANVNRYSEFLKKFSKNIQFIVITHRKGTMEAANIMYGVTMEEKGVSKVVSVDLAK